jgi:NAD(P)-dependent dehydrogenase (short-subunit alcohol dehydrogenase family)
MWRNQFEEKKMNSLEGKIVLVTGAARGIGAAIRGAPAADSAAAAGDQALNRGRKTRT